MYIVNYFSVWPEIVFVEVCRVKKTVMVGMYPLYVPAPPEFQENPGDLGTIPGDKVCLYVLSDVPLQTSTQYIQFMPRRLF